MLMSSFLVAAAAARGARAVPPPLRRLAAAPAPSPPPAVPRPVAAPAPAAMSPVAMRPVGVGVGHQTVQLRLNVGHRVMPGPGVAGVVHAKSRVRTPMVVHAHGQGVRMRMRQTARGPEVAAPALPGQRQPSRQLHLAARVVRRVLCELRVHLSKRPSVGEPAQVAAHHLSDLLQERVHRVGPAYSSSPPARRLAVVVAATRGHSSHGIAGHTQAQRRDLGEGQEHAVLCS